MIAVQCSECQKTLELSEAPETGKVVCPDCGRDISVRPSVADADQETRAVEPADHPSKAAIPGEKDTPAATPPSTADIGRPAPSQDPTLGVSPNTPNAADFAARPAAPRSLAYPFLSPPRGPDELGWLGNYRVRRVLGSGGMGTVFLAEDTCLDRQVALKTMQYELAQDPQAVQRFLREARATAAIRSDHIVTIYQVGQENGVAFLAMELLEGDPLDRWLDKQKPTVNQTLDLGLQIAKGLDAAHRSGLVHRDIKPANVWVEANTGRVKILDFGLVRVSAEDARITQTGMIMGTPAYMAPEQADGERVDSRTDLFSLGCVLYELSTGQLPFERTSTLAALKAVALHHPPPPHELNGQVPEPLSHLIGHMMEKDRERRPQSAGDVVAALEEIAGANTQTRRCLTSGATLRRTYAQRRRAPYVYAAAGLVALIAFGLALYWRFGPRENAAPPVVPGGPDIVFGMSAPFNGPSRELGREMKLGIETYFNYVNNQGGIRGRKLKLVALDDEYEPDKALENMKILHDEHKVLGVIGNVGTPTAEKTLPFALANKMLFFGALTGADLLRKVPPDRYVFNFRASYEQETAAVVGYLLEVKGFTPESIAVFAQKDGYGEAGFRGVARALKGKLPPDKILRVGYERNTTNVKEAVDTILAHPETKAVVIVGTYRPAARFIKDVRAQRPDMIFTNVSFVGSEALAEELKELNVDGKEGVIVTQVVPHFNSQASAVIDFRERLKEFAPAERPSFVSLEGYLAAALLVEAIRLAGNDVTTETIVAALESIDKIDLGVGAEFDFGKSDHQASHKVWGTILKLKDGQLVYETLDLQ